jgi:iron-sulfur cluster assembly accessory protein
MFTVINKPAVSLTERAIAKVKEIRDAQGRPDAALRIYVAGGGCSGFKYGMELDAPAETDELMEMDGLQVVVDPMNLPLLTGCSVDYIEDELLGAGFKVENPNAEATCGCGQSFKAR